MFPIIQELLETESFISAYKPVSTQMKLIVCDTCSMIHGENGQTSEYLSPY